MLLLMDPQNKEVIEMTSTKASTFLYEKIEELKLVKVASVHSTQKINSDFTGIGYDRTITATVYVKKYNLK